MPPPRHPPPPPPMPPLGASAGASADAFADASANVPAGAAVALLGSQPASRTPNAPKYPACFFASEGKLMISARFLKHFGSACAFRSVATRVSWPLMLETSLYVTFGLVHGICPKWPKCSQCWRVLGQALFAYVSWFFNENVLSDLLNDASKASNN